MKAERKRHQSNLEKQIRWWKRVTMVLSIAVLLCISGLIGLRLVINEQNKTMSENRRAITNLRNITTAIRENHHNLQFQVDSYGLWWYQHGTNEITMAEVAAKIEDDDWLKGRVPYEVKPYPLPWEQH